MAPSCHTIATIGPLRKPISRLGFGLDRSRSLTRNPGRSLRSAKGCCSDLGQSGWFLRRNTLGCIAALESAAPDWVGHLPPEEVVFGSSPAMEEIRRHIEKAA